MGRPFRDFSKETIGELQPLYIDESKPRGSGKNIYWICKCSCGNLISVNSCNLNSGIRNKRKMSCGKCHIHRQDLTGKVFGKLTVKGIDDKYIPNKKNGWKTKWICECECGNIVSVFRDNLIRLHTSSCGCINASIGETNIEQILKSNNIIYQKEFSFLDLKFKRPLRFDFAIFNSDEELIELIEFDGRQHVEDYTPWGHQESLADRQYKDNLKNEYCKENNIKLIRIPYYLRDKITLELLELKDYV